MKEPWCLAASTADEPARTLINLYAKLLGEDSRRGGFPANTKDLRFGMGPRIDACQHAGPARPPVA